MTKQKTLTSAAQVDAPSDAQSNDHDWLVPDPQVWAEFGITSMTGHRWTHDPDLDFPPPIKIRTRCFRSRKAIEAFKARMIRKAIRERKTASA